MPGVFCQYIDLHSENFIPTEISPLKVLLSVSWDQNNFTNANEASATWSEDVSKNGFKACVLVAGRHLNSDFKKLPSVHWSVFQKQMFDSVSSIKVGSTTLDTWYTGTQCKVVHSFTGNIPMTNVYASVEHKEKKNYQNAMTVWSEISGSSSSFFSTKYVRVCAREFQNFDGIHKGIVVVSALFLYTIESLSHLH